MDEDGKEWPVACVSTLDDCVGQNEIERTLKATRYCLRRLHEVLLVAPRITVRVPVRGVVTFMSSAMVGSPLISLVAEL